MRSALGEKLLGAFELIESKMNCTVDHVKSQVISEEGHAHMHLTLNDYKEIAFSLFKTPENNSTVPDALEEGAVAAVQNPSMLKTIKSGAKAFVASDDFQEYKGTLMSWGKYLLAIMTEYWKWGKWIAGKLFNYWFNLVFLLNAPVSFVKAATRVLPEEGGVREGVHNSLKSAVRGCFFAKVRSALH